MASASLDQTVRVWDIGGLRKKNAAPGGGGGGPGGGDDMLRLPQVGAWHQAVGVGRPTTAPSSDAQSCGGWSRSGTST